MTDILTRTLRPSDDAVESTVGDETVILHRVNGTYYGLDAVGTRIWSMMKDAVPTTDVCQQLAGEFGIELATIEDDARRFLGELKAQGLLVDD